MQTLRFAPIETEEIKKHLLSTKQFSQPDAEILAKLAHGRLGSALELDLEKFRTRRELMFKVLQSLLQTNDRAVLLQTAEEMNDAKNKDDYEKYLDALQTLIHDIWTLKLGGTEIINADLEDHLKRFAENADSKKLSNWLTEIELMRERFAVNINKKIATDALFMQMARLRFQKFSIQIQPFALKSFHNLSRHKLYENQDFLRVIYLFAYFFRIERAEQTNFSRRHADTGKSFPGFKGELCFRNFGRNFHRRQSDGRHRQDRSSLSAEAVLSGRSKTRIPPKEKFTSRFRLMKKETSFRRVRPKVIRHCGKLPKKRLARPNFVRRRLIISRVKSEGWLVYNFEIAKSSWLKLGYDLAFLHTPIVNQKLALAGIKKNFKADWTAENEMLARLEEFVAQMPPAGKI